MCNIRKFQRLKQRQGGLLVELIIALSVLLTGLQFAVGHYVVLHQQFQQKTEEVHVYEQAMIAARNLAAGKPVDSQANLPITWDGSQLTVRGDRFELHIRSAE